MVGCGPGLLNEVRNDRETALADMNFEKEFPDGGWVKAQTNIDIIGNTVTVTTIFEGEGEMYLEHMHRMEHEALTGEFKADFKRNYADVVSECACTDLKVNVTKL